MGLGSETAVERESVKWEVGPTKDAVQAFMEFLVDPKLPYECFINDTPSEDAQKSISRQMHAVVLLYNYYHRKQKPELEFLNFVSFCKLALSLRPKMTSFMKMIHKSDAVELNGVDDQLSVTEKAIKNACDIAMSLDASKDVPIIEGYPISKVAVLLIDSEKENCLLQRDVVTEGVWSLIEKEIHEVDTNQEKASRVCKKKKTNDEQTLADHNKFLQICFDAVKDVAGIDVSDLVVLEAHVVYSLSNKNSATQFYMVKCKQSFDTNQSFPLENLLESLQGPLAEKFMDSWVSTSPVEYYCLLPYVGFISSWLPRKDSCVPIFSDYIAQSIKKNEDEISLSRVPALSLAEYSVDDLNYITGNIDEKKIRINSSDNVANVDGKDSQKKRKHSSGGKTASSLDTFCSEKHGHATDDGKTKCNILNSGNKCTIRVSSENLDKGGETPVKASLSGCSRGQSPRVVKDDNSLKRTNMSVVSKILLRREIKRMDSNIMSKNVSCVQHDANDPEDDVNLMAETTDILKSNDDRSRDESLTADTFSNGNEIAAADNSLDLQNALTLLTAKRQGLYSRLCSMEDTLASYEHIIDLVRDGGEVGARECIKYLLSGRDVLLLLKNQNNSKQSRFPNIFLPGKSSCQDLEYICLKNNWRMPRYVVLSSEGKFFSSVAVHRTGGSVLSSKGGLEATPLESRESAAAQMIIKIRALIDEEAGS